MSGRGDLVVSDAIPRGEVWICRVSSERRSAIVDGILHTTTTERLYPIGKIVNLQPDGHSR